MAEKHPKIPSRVRIDLADYPRADIFRAFVNRQMPQFSLTCEVDVTGIHRRSVECGLSFFVCVSHAVSMAVNAVPQFRHRVIDGELYEYERTDPGYTIALENELFSFCDGLHIDDFSAYCTDAQARIEAVKSQPDLAVYEKHHMFFISCLPWLSFTAFNHPYEPIYGYIPVITLGRFTRRGDAVVMPVAVQVHHGVVDGVHVAHFYRKLEALSASASDWLLTPPSRG